MMRDIESDTCARWCTPVARTVPGPKGVVMPMLVSMLDIVKMDTYFNLFRCHGEGLNCHACAAGLMLEG